MADFGTFALGVSGGVIGAFIKLWIDDLREWSKSRLTFREKDILARMHFDHQDISFEVKAGSPPFYQHRIIVMDNPKLNVKFEDLGEMLRLTNLGLIEEVTRTNEKIIYRITGKGYKLIEKLKL
jgi:hypothetical protein